MLTAQQVYNLMPDASELMSDEPEMESSLHYEQLALLVSCLEWLWRDRQDFFIGANLTVYYSRQQLKKRDFRGPDFFLVKDTERKARNSWVVWEEEGRYPNLIIELLSDSTAQVDRTTKKVLYQSQWQTPEYFWFSPKTLEFCGFRLGSQRRYDPIVPTDQGWLWSQELNLYLGIHDRQLRYFDVHGQMVPTLQEFNRLEIQRTERERQRANALALEIDRLRQQVQGQSDDNE
jgi:Uma2 family endonuclease